MRRILSSTASAAFCVVSVVSCGGEDGVVVDIDGAADTIEFIVAGSALTTDTLRLQAGQTAELAAEVLDDADEVVGDATVTWGSTDPSVATIDDSGLVEAQAPGQTDLSASVEDVTAIMPTVVREASDSEPLPAGTLLTSDWSTATGNSLEAVSDGGKGEVRWCDWSEVLSVEPGSAVGWTGTSNVLSIRSIDGCGHVEYENVFPRPSDDEEQFWAVRYYAMNGEGQTDTKMHPHTFWPVGAIESVHLGISTSGLSGGDWVLRPRWTFSGDEFPFGVEPKSADGTRQHIEAGTWVRYEFILQWLNATEFRWYPRVYDMAGNLLWDEYDFRHTDTNLSLGEWYDSSPSNVLTRTDNSADPDHIRTIAFGMGQVGSSGQHYYIADVALALVSDRNDFLGTASDP